MISTRGSGGTVASSAGDLVGSLGRVGADPDLVAEVNEDSASGAADDNSIHFPGGDGLIMSGDDTSFVDLILGPTTVEAWVNVDEYAQEWEDIFRLENTLKLGFHNGSIVFTTLGVYDYLSEVPVPAGDWHHVAVVWEPGVGATFYLDGVESAFVAHTGLARDPENTDISIGWSHGQTSMLIGSIDRLRMHAAMLDPADLDSDAANPKGVYDSHCRRFRSRQPALRRTLVPRVLKRIRSCVPVFPNLWPEQRVKAAIPPSPSMGSIPALSSRMTTACCRLKET